MSDEWIGSSPFCPVCDDCPSREVCDFEEKGVLTYCPDMYYQKYRYPALKQIIKDSINKEMEENHG